MARPLLSLAHTWPLEHLTGIEFPSYAIQVDQTQVFDARRYLNVVFYMQIIKITGNSCMELASVRGKYESWGCHRTGRKVTNAQISFSAHIYICTLAKQAAYGITHESGKVQVSDCQNFQQMKHYLAPWQEFPLEKALNSWNAISVNVWPGEVHVTSPNSHFLTTTSALNCSQQR